MAGALLAWVIGCNCADAVRVTGEDVSTPTANATPAKAMQSAALTIVDLRESQDDPLAQVSGLDRLGELAGRGFCSEVVDAGGCRAAAAALSRHARDAKVQCAGLSLLKFLAEENFLSEVAMAFGPLEVASAMARHLEDSWVQARGLAVLVCFAEQADRQPGMDEKRRALGLRPEASSAFHPTPISAAEVRAALGPGAIEKALEAHPEAWWVQGHAFRLLTIFFEENEEAAREVISTCNGPYIAAALERHADSWQVQSAGLALWSALAGKWQEVAREAIGVGGHTLCAAALGRHESVASVQCAGFHFLVALATEHASEVMKVFSPGSVTVSLENHLESVDVQTAGLCLLTVLAEEGFHNDIVSEGGIAAVTSALGRHGDDGGVQLCGRALLDVLGQQGHEVEAMVPATHGTGSLLATTAAANSGEVTEGGLGSPSWAGLDTTIKRMRRPSSAPEAIEEACVLLKDAACNDGGRSKVIEFGGVQALIQAMQTQEFIPGVQSEACRALCCIMRGPGMEIEVARLGGIKAAMQAMHRHAWSADVQEKACWMLQQLTMSAECRRAAASMCVDLITKAIQRHAHVAMVQESGILVLGNLAVEDDLRTVVMRVGGIDSVLQSMKAHEEDGYVQDAAAFVLYNLACSRESAAKIASLGGVASLKRAIELHPWIGEAAETQALLGVLLAVAQPVPRSGPPPGPAPESLKPKVRRTSSVLQRKVPIIPDTPSVFEIEQVRDDAPPSVDGDEVRDEVRSEGRASGWSFGQGMFGGFGQQNEEEKFLYVPPPDVGSPPRQLSPPDRPMGGTRQQL